MKMTTGEKIFNANITLTYASEFTKFSCTQSKNLGLLKWIERKENDG